MAAGAHLHTAAGSPRLGVGFAPTSGLFSTGLPVLGGQPVERVFDGAVAAGTSGPFTLFRAGDWLLGAAVVDNRGDLAEAVRSTYAELFAAARGRQLARIWNYVPAINEPGPDGQENYRTFNHGRSRAFEAEFGGAFRRSAPAASAVGTDATELAVVFAATTRVPRHFENPRQVPAYQYPPEHGPRPPTFARATVVPAAEGRADVFISGTSSIHGHATVAPGDTPRQLACTVENLRGIAAACGTGFELGSGRATARHFKIYLRNAGELAETKAFLERDLFTPADRVSYVRSDICRRELNVEIEATLLGVPVPG